MSGKHKKGKVRSRVLHSLATKMEILKHNEKGKTNFEISQLMGIAQSTIYDIVKNAVAIKAAAKKAGTHKALISKVNGAASLTTKHKTFSANTKTKVLTGKVNSASFLTTKHNHKTLSADSKKKERKPHTFHSLATRTEVWRLGEKGYTPVEIARATKISKSTVRNMLKAAAKKKAAAKRAAARMALANKMNMTVIVKDNCKDLFVGAPKKAKKPCVKHPLSTQLEVLRRSENGEKPSDIGRNMCLAKSTVSNILNRARKIKAAAKEAIARDASPSEANGTTEGYKDIVMENMERLLKIWIDEQLSQPGALNDETIQRKALSLWKFVWDSLGPEEKNGLVNNFTASTAWLKRFKEGTTFCTLPMIEAKPRFVSSPLSPKSEVEPKSPVKRGIGVAKGFSSLLRAKIEVGGYTPRHVINMDEMGLLWKKLPANTIINVGENASQGYRAGRDQFSLMLGANATGDLKLKPLLVYHMESPHSLTGYIKEYLPVIWRSHPRGRVVPALCQNYVVDYVSQRCKEYAMEHNLRNRFLLLVDNGPAYPPSMDDWADNIEVMFVPTMSRSVVQPMDHGITATFKLCYLFHLLEQLIRETDGDSKASLHDFWQNYNVRKALNNIKMAWDDITPYTLNVAWQSIWPECVRDSSCRASPKEPTEQDVVGLAHQAGFLQVTTEHIKELLNSPCEELSSEDIFQMELDQASQEHEEEPEMEAVKTLDINLLGHALGLFDEAMAALEQNDQNCTRSCDARRFMERGIRAYRELYATKKRKAQNSSIFCPHFN